MTVAYLDDIDQVQYKFTELGQTIEDLSSQHKGYFKDTVAVLSEGFEELQTTLSASEIQQTKGLANVVDSRIVELSKLFGDVLSQVSSGFATMITTSEDAHQGIAKIAEALKTATDQSGAQVSAAGVPIGGGKRVYPSKKGRRLKVPKVLQRELKTIKSSAYSMMGKLKIPKPGAIVAGGIMAASYGFMYKDRINKEMGEIKNTLESAFDYGIKSVRQKGVSAFSDMQENLQRYVGISKGEVQAITKTFSQGGVGIGEMLADIHSEFGDVGKSAVHASLALDKMFEVPGGTMAQKAVGYMHNYGMSLKEANEMTRDLHLNDQAFKIGVPTFVQNVESAADTLKDFGFSIRGVMDLAGSLQEQFENIGVPRQFAGKMAGQGVQQIAQGIAGMSDDWKVFMGQRMYGKTGMEALQKFEEGFSRVKRGGSVEEYMDVILNMFQVAQEVNEGDEAQMYAFISRKAGWGSRGARATLEIGKIYEEKGGIAAVKATTEHMKTFKVAFETESEKDSKFRQKMNLWMEGVSDIGQGLLGLIGKTFAYLIGLFKAYPSIFSALVAQDWDRLSRIRSQIRGLTKGASADVALFKKGWKKLGKAGKSLLGDVFESSVDSLTSAFSDDFSGLDVPKPTGRPSVLGVPRQSITKTVYIPVDAAGAGQAYDAPVKAPVLQAAKQFAKQKGVQWFGGGLSIVSKGVDEHGNLGLGLIGNCPQCGLIFGGGTVGSKDTGYVGSSVIEGVNTGQATPVDLSAENALEQIRDVSLTGNMRRKIEKAGKDVQELDPELLPVFQKLAKRYGGKNIKVYKTLGAGEKMHGQGKAADISIKGVKSSDLYKYLRSEGYGKTQGGLGYYTQAPFVHVDVRDKPSTWVDTSGKGEEEEAVTAPVAWLQQNIGLDNG